MKVLQSPRQRKFEGTVTRPTRRREYVHLAWRRLSLPPTPVSRATKLSSVPALFFHIEKLDMDIIRCADI